MQPNICPLCSIGSHRGDIVHYLNDDFIVVSTKDKKGHFERIMIIYINHEKDITPVEYDNAMFIIDSICPEIFDYTDKVVVMDGKYSELKDHWHLVITDIEPDCDDFPAILHTPWLRVIDLENDNRVLV